MKRSTFIQDVKLERDIRNEYVTFMAGPFVKCRAKINVSDGFLDWGCHHNHTQSFNPDRMVKIRE